MKNENLQQLINELKKKSISENVKIWKRIATYLEKPTRQRRVVNLSRIERYAKDNENIIIPGKVLSSGDINKKVNVTALSFSDKAKEKIIKAGGQVTEMQDIISKPAAKGMRILG